MARLTEVRAGGPIITCRARIWGFSSVRPECVTRGEVCGYCCAPCGETEARSSEWVATKLGRGPVSTSLNLNSKENEVIICIPSSAVPYGYRWARGQAKHPNGSFGSNETNKAQNLHPPINQSTPCSFPHVSADSEV